MKRMATILVALIFAGANARAEESSRFKTPHVVTLHAPHQARLVDHGLAALDNMLEMIGRAHQSIELEFFKFSPDQSGRLVLQALTQKARQGVKVRILVDYLSQRLRPGLDAFYKAELAKDGIEVKYFNVSPPVEVWKMGFRDHRKLFIIDGGEFVTGGRNLSDEYFGLSDRVNYLDRDVWLKGPIAQAALDSFNAFWDAPIVETIEDPQKPVFNRKSVSSRPATMAQDKDYYFIRLHRYEERVAMAKDTLTPQPRDRDLRKKLSQLGKQELVKSPILEVHSVSFVSDLPVPGDEGRIMTPYWIQRLEGTTQSLLIENLTFLVKDETKQALLNVLKRGVQVDILTNSFLSEPVPVMAELTNSRQNMAVENGARVYCYSASPMPGESFIHKDGIWGLHTKSMVIDDKDSMIGSYNLDPRSAWINVEDSVYINDSPQFARLVKESTMKRIKYAYRMDEDGDYINGPACYDPGRLLTILLRPLVELTTDQL